MPRRPFPIGRMQMTHPMAKLRTLPPPAKAQVRRAILQDGSGTITPASVAPSNDIVGITGIAAVGQTLTANAGDWDFTGTLTLTYQWLRNGTPIFQATSTTYVVQAADLGALISVRETAQDASGTNSSTSLAVGPVAAALVAPANLTLPAFNDTTPTEGQTLTITPGTYSGTAPIAVTRSVRRVTGDVLLTDLGGGVTWVVPQAEVGNAVYISETAQNLAGSVTVSSAATSLVAAANPGPTIADQTFSITESAGIGATVGTVANTGGAAGAWSISGGAPFAISASGVIRTTAALDFSVTTSYTRTVTATNDTGSDTATITINVLEATGEANIAAISFIGTGAPADTISTFGHGFKIGDIQPSDDVVIRRLDTGAALRTQMDVIGTHTDGSVRVAAMAVELPEIAAGAVLECQIVKGAAHPSPGADLAISSALPATLTITPTTGSPFVLSVKDALSGAPWRAGPLVVEYRARVLVPAANAGGVTSVYAQADIQYRKDGSTWVDFCPTNDRFCQEGGGGATLAFACAINGTTVHSVPSQPVRQYTRHPRQFGRTASGAAPTPAWPKFDLEYWAEAGFSSRYQTDLPMWANTATYLSGIVNAADFNALYYPASIPRNTGGAGGRPDLATDPTTVSATMVYSGDLAWRALIRQAEAQATWPISHWDTGRADGVETFAVPSEFPRSYWRNTNQDPLTTPRATRRGLPPGQSVHISGTDFWQPDIAHTTCVVGPAAVMTGRRTLYDATLGLAVWAVWEFPDRDGGNTAIDYTTGVGIIPHLVNSQTRGVTRSFQCAIWGAMAVPDSQVAAADFRGIANAFPTRIMARSAEFNVGLDPEVQGIIPSNRTNPDPAYWHISMWQFDIIVAWLDRLQRVRPAGVDVGAVQATMQYAVNRRANGLLQDPAVYMPTAEPGRLNTIIGTKTGANAGHTYLPNFAAAGPIIALNGGFSGGTPPTRDWQGGNFNNEVVARMISTLAIASRSITDRNRAGRAADAFAWLVSEPPGPSGVPAVRGVFVNNWQKDLIVPTRLHSYVDTPAAAPVILPNQILVADPLRLGVGDAVGIVETSGSVPRASARGADDIWEITAQSAGNYFSVSRGGVIRIAATPPTDATYTVTLRCRHISLLSDAVTVTVSVPVVTSLDAEVSGSLTVEAEGVVQDFQTPLDAEVLGGLTVEADGAVADFSTIFGTTATDWVDVYALRRVVSGYGGSAIRIRRASDNAEQDIGFVSSALGALIDEAAITSFIGSSQGFVTTWYGQGRGLNLTQTTASAQPTITAAGGAINRIGGANTRACINFATDDFLENASFATRDVNQFSAFMITQRAAAPVGTDQDVFDFSSGASNNQKIRVFHRTNGNYSIERVGANINLAGTPHAAPKYVSGVWAPTTTADGSTLRINGAGTAASNGGTSNFGTGTLQIGARIGGTNFLTGSIAEIHFAAETDLDADVPAIESNLSTFIG